MKNAVFGPFDFQAQGLTVRDVDIYGMPTRTTQIERLAAADGAVLVLDTFGPKRITVEGLIHSDSSDNLEAKIDTLKGLLRGRQQTLDIPFAGSTRRYTATASNVMFSRNNHGVTTAAYSFEFIAPDGYGYSTTSETVLGGTWTSADNSIAFTVEGTADAYPVITLDLTTTSPATDTELTITNPATGAQVQLTFDASGADTIVIDCMKRRGYINNAPVYVAGLFPHWEPGSGTLEISDTLADRIAGIELTYTPRWM